MSKKKFKKKKNKKHGHQPTYIVQKPIISTTPTTSQSVTDVTEAPEVIEEKAPEPTADAVIPAEEEKEFAYVRRDVKKILIVMGSIVVLLIIAFIVNSKTTAFYSMGNWLYQALNIQTQ